MIKKRVLMLMLLSISGCNSYYSEKNLSDFEKMMSGFPTCFFKDVYFNTLTKAPEHPYFVDRNLMPDSIDQDLAHFNIDEDYHGLKVYKVAIPVTFSLHIIYFQEPVARVKKQLEDIYYLGFYSSFPRDYDPRTKPVLKADPDDNERSMLYCDTEMY